MKRVELVKPQRCVFYCRYSTDEQNPMSIDSQIAVCKEEMEKHEGWHLVAEPFVDEHISGTGFGNRPGLLAMLELADSGGFDVLIINDLYRLSREDDLSMIIGDLRDQGLKVIGPHDNYDSESELADMQVKFAEMTSKQTIKNISRRTHAELRRLVKDGKQAGGCAYGYVVKADLDPVKKDKWGRPEVSNKRLEKHPETSKVVRQIFTMFADDGLSANTIAARLNAESVPSPGSYWRNRKKRRCSGWTGSAVTVILNNPIYAGLYVWNKTQGKKIRKSGKIKYTTRPNTEWEEHKRPHLCIFDDGDDLWERTRAKQRERVQIRGGAISKGIAAAKAKRIGGADSRYLLGSILQCVCGANLIGDGTKDFICPRYADGGCDNDLRVRRDDVNRAVLGPLNEYLFSDEAVAWQQAQARADLQVKRREEEKAATKPAITAALKVLDEQETNLRRLSLTPDTLNAALTSLDRQRADLQAKATGKSVERVSLAERRISQLPQTAATYRAMFERGAAALTDLAHVSAAREAMKKLINGPIVLTPNASHTRLEGTVHFSDLGDQLLKFAGSHRTVKAVEQAKKPTREKHQENQEKAIMVAGARYLNYLRVDLV